MPAPLRISKKLSGRLTPSHARSKQQEREAAMQLLVAGSGCGSVKGDCRLKGVVRLECKTTRRKSFALTRDLVEKIEAAAMGTGEAPAFEIEFCDEQGRKQMACLVMPTWVLAEYVKEKTNGTR